MPRLSLTSPVGRLTLFEEGGAITALVWGGKSAGQPTRILNDAKRQLAAYFAGKRKSFDLDLARCIFCGLCEEVCPVAAIVMTRFYEGSTFDKRDFLLTKEKLMANQVYAHKEVHVQAAGEPVEAKPVTANPFEGLSASRPTAMAADAASPAAGAAPSIETVPTAQSAPAAPEDEGS